MKCCNCGNQVSALGVMALNESMAHAVENGHCEECQHLDDITHDLGAAIDRFNMGDATIKGVGSLVYVNAADNSRWIVTVAKKEDHN